jgi:hypothetical protein
MLGGGRQKNLALPILSVGGPYLTNKRGCARSMAAFLHTICGGD